MPRTTLVAALLLVLSIPAGLRAEHRISNTPIAACSGTFTDSGGSAGSYGNSENFVQTIWPSRPATRIQLEFTSFVSETDFDELIFANGHNALAPLLWTMTGSAPPVAVRSTAADGSLTLSWASDSSVVGAGWVATISCLPVEQRMSNDTVALCSGRFTDSGGSTGPYGNSEGKVLTVFPDRPGARVAVTFSSFSTVSIDRLIVIDGASTTDPVIGSFTGTTVPPALRATNSEGALTFDFLSDDSVVSSGWDASFRCEQPLVATSTLVTCDGVLTDSGGSGGFYSANENFDLVLLPSDPEAKLELQFLAFDTESGSDFLSLFHGNGGSSVLAGTYSGTAFPAPVTSPASDGSLTLIWASGPLVNRPGWVAPVRCVYPIRNDVVTACGATATDTGGRFGAYLDNEDLVQNFEPAMPRSRIRLGFESFQSEDGFDQLKIHDGGSLGPQIHVLQGSPAMPFSIAGSDPSGRMGVVWHSDVAFFFAGYVATATCDPPLVVDEFESGDLGEWAAKTP